MTQPPISPVPVDTAARKAVGDRIEAWLTERTPAPEPSRAADSDDPFLKDLSPLLEKVCSHSPRALEKAGLRRAMAFCRTQLPYPYAEISRKRAQRTTTPALVYYGMILTVICAGVYLLTESLWVLAVLIPYFAVSEILILRNVLVSRRDRKLLKERKLEPAVWPFANYRQYAQHTHLAPEPGPGDTI